MENIEDICNWLIDDDHDEFNLLDHESIYNYRRPRLIKPRIDWFNLYDAIDFETRFRITKENFVIILEKIEHKIRSQTERNNCIPPIIQLLTTLRFFSTGSFAITIADFIGISETSALRIIHKVSFAITELHKEFIKFPSDNNGILKCQVENYQLSGFIRIIGAIDCFHVRIRSYGGENGELFRNGKGFFSINVQAIVNSRLEIMDLVARWPGSTHDATIFDNSKIKMRFENGEFGNAMLLGDSGYPCLPYLLTPLTNPLTPSAVLYNEAHIRTRCMVERCFGVLGKKFPVLTIGSRFLTPQRTLPMITACAVIHNISRRSIELEMNYDIYNNMNRQLDENLHDQERSYIIDNYFQSLL